MNKYLIITKNKFSKCNHSYDLTKSVKKDITKYILYQSTKSYATQLKWCLKKIHTNCTKMY